MAGLRHRDKSRDVDTADVARQHPPGPPAPASQEPGGGEGESRVYESSESIESSEPESVE